MSTRPRLVRAGILGLSLTMVIVVAAACNKTTGSGSSGSGGASTSSAGGESLFTANCSKCHSINGSGSKRAPDLSHIGAESEHTADWLASFIKNPSSQKPGSRMPAFEGKLSDSDIRALADYLAGLK